MCIYPLIVFTDGLVIGVEFVRVLVLSCLCLLIVVWILVVSIMIFCIYLVFIFSPGDIPKKYDMICAYKFNL